MKVIKSRPPIERMAYIARLLRDKADFTSPTVAAHFEMERKAIDRDIEFMRDRLGFTIEYRGGTYRGHGPRRRVL